MLIKNKNYPADSCTAHQLNQESMKTVLITGANKSIGFEKRPCNWSGKIMVGVIG
jgi:hypothetical protein